MSPRRTARPATEVLVRQAFANAGFDPCERFALGLLVAGRLGIFLGQASRSQAFARKVVQEPADLAGAEAAAKALVNLVGDAVGQLLRHIGILYVTRASPITSCGSD